MKVIRKEYTYPSVTGVADIFARSWAPENGEIKAVFQLAHGMAEHGERYEEMAAYLCEQGYAFIMNDHVGHGRSINSDDDLGYFNGDKNKAGIGFVEDVHKLTLMAKKEFNKPVILMGHSMGSFVARHYVTKYASDIEGAIFCGTAGPNPAAGAGILVASLIEKVKGPKFKSEFINGLAFGAYNKRFEGRTAFDWLSVNKENIDKYIDDKYCGFLFTLSGYKNLFEILQFISTPDAFSKTPKDLPMYLIAGAEDPVGMYGKGVKTVYDKFVQTGHKNVSIKLYDGLRHEIHNEDERFTVYADIAKWCDSVID
ncbi:MAG: alpha/beta fold hydrolase [Acutalibacteraceae bacterium]|nr:alpha/beta fold hydrolase [Acutalibacteraceae bacterium]